MTASPHASIYRQLVAEGDAADAPQRIQVELRGDRAVLTLDEPDRMNALSAPLVRQLRRALETLDSDPDVRSVVLIEPDVVREIQLVILRHGLLPPTDNS